MRKIFVASLRIWAPTFVNKISSLQVKIDFFGCKSNYRFSDNVNYLGECSWPFKSVLDYLIEHYKEYDLIVMPDFNWQVNDEFNKFRESVSLPILCPSYSANELERNKLFSKKLFDDLTIPTPKYFEYQDLTHLEENIETKFVFKLADDWIHSGHQTMIFDNDNYKRIIPMFFQKGYVGKCYIEEFVEGQEAILHFLCNGTDNIYLGSSRDYKKMYDGDTGINVSSTGSYSPVEYVDKNIISSVKNCVSSIQQKIDYVGIMCVGIIITNSNFKILEINVRPGTPEFTTLLYTVESENLLDNLINAANRRPMTDTKFVDVSAVTIQLLNKNYNFEMKSDAVLPDDSSLVDLDIVYFSKEFHRYNYYSSITAIDTTRIFAAEKIYKQLNLINLGDYRFRTDIGLFR